MIRKIKSYLLVAVMGLTLGAPALVPAFASAECTNIAKKISTGSEGAAGETGAADCSSTSVSDTGITNAAKKIVNLISIIVGIVAVIIIIFGGFRYITSGGDSGKVGNAKNSLIYAIVGLIIVALAQLIVRFVLNQSSNITTT